MPHTIAVDALVAFFLLQKQRVYIQRFELMQITGKWLPVYCMDKNNAHRFENEAQAVEMLRDITPECTRDYQTEWVAVALVPLSYETNPRFSTLVNHLNPIQ